MNKQRLDEFLLDLSSAPDSQISKDQTQKLTLLIGKPATEIAQGLKQILDDCCYASLASDFAMMALDRAWNEAKKLTD